MAEATNAQLKRVEMNTNNEADNKRAKAVLKLHREELAEPKDGSKTRRVDSPNFMTDPIESSNQ